MMIRFARQWSADGGAVAVLVPRSGDWSAAAALLDRSSGGQLRRACVAARFGGAVAEVCEVLAPAGIAASRVLVVGLGDLKRAGAAEFESIGGTLCARLLCSGDTNLAVETTGLEEAAIEPAELAARIAFGARLRGYRFDRYRTAQSQHAKPTLAEIRVVTRLVRPCERRFERMEAVAAGVFMARDLVSEPANVLFPKSFAGRIRSLATHGVRVQVLGEKRLKQLGFGALLGVSQGSAYEPQVVICEYDGIRAKRPTPPVVLAGKGVTFDAGGISIKPSAGLETLKQDMGGAASVVGAIKTLAMRKARCHVVGICGLVENMPSGTAQRPGDVITSLSGKTVEVINTDAEGRLVLCDILWYAQQRYRPKVIVDMATLTGAIVIALGQEFAGLFCNDAPLAARLIDAGHKTGDRLWQFPMGEAYDKHLDSLIADMKNLGPNEGRSIIAAQFIKRFVQEGVAWAHVDFGGMVWTEADTALSPKGATGFGVRLLDKWLATHHERP
ncbi:MAG: leucyl aminopeptidase [Steroidobacteraceae bacterium]